MISTKTSITYSNGYLALQLHMAANRWLLHLEVISVQLPEHLSKDESCRVFSFLNKQFEGLAR